MEEEDDDFYTQNGDAPVKNEQPNQDDAAINDADADLEDGQDDDDDDDEDDDDSDIDIITEHKDGPPPEPPQARPFRGIKPEPPRTASTDTVPTQRTQQPSALKSETPAATSAQAKKLVSLKDGSKYPDIRTSSIDANATPTWDSAGKLITEVDIDADLAEHTKPWRLPGTDQTDFFNYGFDEFTWTQYCLRQQGMASTINNQKAETKQFEMMLTGGGMPGQSAPAAPQGPPPGAPMAMGMGMPDMSPENMAAFASVLQSQGIDPSQLDFNTFMQHYQQASMGGMQGMPGQGGQAGFGGQSMQPQGSNQGFGGQQSQYQQNQGYRGSGTPQPQQQGQQSQGQPQGYDGYSAQQIAMMQQGGGIPSGPSGGGRGRGRGRRGGW